MSTIADTPENLEEQEYLNSLKRCLECQIIPNRTDTPAYTSLFETLKFDLSNNTFPLFTTKRVALRSVFYELMWFLRGDQDISWLKSHGVPIWDGNTTRNALDKAGLYEAPIGYVGPAYGCQWRSFGMRGVDQIKNVIRSLREEPLSRRHIVCAWNPLDISHMALPPCHYSFQFICSPLGESYELSCVVNMRSADAPLGVPFNVASYSLLTYIVAGILAYTPGKLILACSNYHIYTTHVQAVREQISRAPRTFPKIRFSQALYNLDPGDIPHTLDYSDVIITNYNPHPRIVMDMIA